MKRFSSILIGLLILVFSAYVGINFFVGAVNVPVGSTQADAKQTKNKLKVPAGFVLSLYADDVPNARELRLTPEGELLVANPNKDQIVLLAQDKNKDGKYDGKKILLGEAVGVTLNGPNGMDFYEDDKNRTWLYVAEQDAVGRIQFDNEKSEVFGLYERLATDLPGGGNHWKKSLRIHSDNLGKDVYIYLSVGSSCNVCVEEDKRRATMMRYRLKSNGDIDRNWNGWNKGKGEIYASGLRNSEGFDWSPIDGGLYATDNGRDMLGDDFPPCELNKIEQGGFYGWPFSNGNKLPDPDYGEGKETEITQSITPVHEFRAHNAPLGMRFLRHQPSSEYQGTALVALHGSWNRTNKDGYKVVSLHWQKNDRGETIIEERDFMSGFLNEDKAIGRPAEIVESADGSIYIADDYAGAIYRVTYAP